ncbi:hypothetical protein [Paenibacillus tepidiphilus]|uniref:hypothetical protein n=1 Tax=Paenibacillus tepidiphilus TaxID=2608683 RepID=UPI001239A4F3|nr:hypothetical protein [Paenibacillus tepidiphilus]
MGAMIALAVRESAYIEPLLHYVHTSEYGDVLRIAAFSRKDTFMEFMKGEEQPDAVIGDTAFIESWLVEGKGGVPWAVLSESGSGLPRSAGALAGGQSIAKYQSLPALLEAMLQFCQVKRSRLQAAARDEPLLLGIASAGGSSGKTTVALNMVKLLGEMGLSVFYLNLESVDSSGLVLRMPSGGTAGLERLLYELKVRGEEGEKRHGNGPEPAAYAIRHEALRADAFRPVENLNEMLQLTRPDTLDLLGCLTGNGGYDVVIADTGAIEEERTRAVLERCGLLLWVLSGDEGNIYKTSRWLAHCGLPHSGMPQGIAEKSRFVLNGAADSASVEAVSGVVRLDGVLPYIPSWDMPHPGELRLNAPPFLAGVKRLCMDLIEPALPRVFTGSAQ